MDPSTTCEDDAVRDAGRDHVAPGSLAEEEVRVESLLCALPCNGTYQSFVEEQAKDPELQEIVLFLRAGELPPVEKRARQIAPSFPLCTRRRCAVLH